MGGNVPFWNSLIHIFTCKFLCTSCWFWLSLLGMGIRALFSTFPSSWAVGLSKSGWHWWENRHLVIRLYFICNNVRKLIHLIFALEVIVLIHSSCLAWYLWKWLGVINQATGLGIHHAMTYIVIILHVHLDFIRQTKAGLHQRGCTYRRLWSLELTAQSLLLFMLTTWYLLRYGVSPFEYALGESGGSLQLAIINAQIKWPAGPSPPYPEALHQFVTWMLQPQPAIRPCIDDIIIHVDKLISKFSNWCVHVKSSEENVFELVLDASSFLYEVRDIEL